MRKRDLGTGRALFRSSRRHQVHHGRWCPFSPLSLSLFSFYPKTLEGFSFLLISRISPNLFCYNPQVMFSLTLTGQEGLRDLLWGISFISPFSFWLVHTHWNLYLTIFARISWLAPTNFAAFFFLFFSIHALSILPLLLFFCYLFYYVTYHRLAKESASCGVSCCSNCSPF